MNDKALLIPLNSKKEMFIQDRRGHKPPPWGFFGGSIEVGETHLEAVIRETKEELDLELTEKDLVYLGGFPALFAVGPVHRYIYVYRTDQEEFTVLEGAGGRWASFAEAAELLDIGDRIEQIIAAVENL